MRQGQQNRRGRGRNRKSQNPLTRSFESNGPDVKIRGTPAHIAEKYISYARDALSSGDPVLAENYLQHAEHYNRIIMAYREQSAQQPGELVNGNGVRHRQAGNPDSLDNSEDEIEDETTDFASDAQRAPVRRVPPNGDGDEQPRIEGDRPQRRQPRARNQRSRQDRNADSRRAQPSEESQEPDKSASRISDEDQPEFLRRPVRRPRREQNGAAAESEDGNVSGRGDAAEEAID